MEDSVTYQAIVRKGRLAGVRQVILRQGRKLFGPIDEEAERTLNAIDDIRVLDKLSDRILDVDSWQELLQPTRTRRRNGRRKGSV